MCNFFRFSSLLFLSFGLWCFAISNVMGGINIFETKRTVLSVSRNFCTRNIGLHRILALIALRRSCIIIFISKIKVTKIFVLLSVVGFLFAFVCPVLGFQLIIFVFIYINKFGGFNFTKDLLNALVKD